MSKNLSAFGMAKIIGITTVLPYIINYSLRSMLSVLTPFMTNTGLYSKEYLAMLSSFYMIAYAVGQLFNGMLGDIFKPKIVVLIGLSAGGIASAAFAFVPGHSLQILCFIVMGYGLSMVRGPFMKIISENTQERYARVICAFFSFASFAGPLGASLISMVFEWNVAFVFAGALTIVAAVAVYISLTVLERKNELTYKSIKSVSFREMFGVLKIEGFFFYLMLAALIEIAGASISFWIPTFLNEFVNFGEEKANMVFSFISLARAFISIAALALFKLFGERYLRIIKLTYMAEFIFFAAMLIVPAGGITVILLLLALIMNSIVSAVLWSAYIPGLGKTGRVSSINGILDCTGYVAASAATSIFAQVVVRFGWTGLIAAWAVIPAIGISLSVGYSKKQRDT